MKTIALYSFKQDIIIYYSSKRQGNLSSGIREILFLSTDFINLTKLGRGSLTISTGFSDFSIKLFIARMVALL